VTLFLVPVAYLILEDALGAWRWLWGDEPKAGEAAPEEAAPEEAELTSELETPPSSGS